MKIGIFGGTFDPPHMGHIAIVGQAIKQLSLDKVIVFPCGVPTHKHTDTNMHHRAEMTKLAFSHLSVDVDTYEFEKSTKSYTIDTVKYVLQLYPDATITLIIGADSYVQLPQWHKYDQLLELVDLAVAVRSGSSIEHSHYDTAVHVLDMGALDISSTDIRLRVQFGLLDEDKLTPQVSQYISKNNLYAKYRELTKTLRQLIKPSRYWHSFHVTATALKLSQGRCIDKVFVASALHDCAKSCFVDYRHLTTENDDIAHAHIGAVVAREKFDICDDAILDAIYYHTTAKPNMSWLEKIVFLADKLEPTRNYDTASLYRDTLDDTLVATLSDLVHFLQMQGKQVHHLTTDALVYYTNITNEGKD